MIIDAFLFFNELDLLEIRLNSLAPYVDRFVLCEMPVTFSGNPKPLYFAENRNRFKDFPIKHYVAQYDPAYEPPAWQHVNHDTARREYCQRERIMDGIVNMRPKGEDIILLSDVDEIPNMENYHIGDEGAFKQKMYYYYVNCFTNTRMWKGTQAIKFKNLTTINDLRNNRNRRPTVVPFGGWHFSTIGNADEIRYKIESITDTQFNTPEIKNNLEDNMRNLKDPYGRVPRERRGSGEYRFVIEQPTGPKYLLDNVEKYKHLFYPGSV